MIGSAQATPAGTGLQSAPADLEPSYVHWAQAISNRGRLWGRTTAIVLCAPGVVSHGSLAVRQRVPEEEALGARGAPQVGCSASGSVQSCSASCAA